MMTHDQQLSMLVKVGRVFTPAMPINRRDLFAGRFNEIRKIMDTVHSSGRHAILYGDRGVGKTSLASILEDLFSDFPQVRIGRVNCEIKDTFASVWDKALAEIPIIKEGPQGNQQFLLNQWLDLQQYVGPGQIRQVLKIGNETIPELVIVFDEFDRLDREQRAMFPDTIKDLADSGTGATIILVGVAGDVTELVAGHASIGRNIAQIEMKPMTPAEIQSILDKGLGNLGMTMTAEAAETIGTLAQGYPHYPHLLGKEAAISAIDDRRLEINTADVFRSVKEAVKDNSYLVADEYHKATMQNRKGTLYEQVLTACALANVDELGYFSSTDVRPVLWAITGKNYEIYGFSQHLNTFSSDQARGPALEKRGSKRCYRYRFKNPMLRPYAIIKGMDEGRVTIEMLQQLSAAAPERKKTKRAPRIMPTPKRSTSSQSTDDGLFKDCP